MIVDLTVENCDATILKQDINLYVLFYEFRRTKMNGHGKKLKGTI